MKYDMDEINTVTIPLERFEELLRDSYDLEQVKKNIENIHGMVIDEIAKDCRRYGEAYAKGDCTSIMCRKLFHEIGIFDPSKHFVVQNALKEYEAKKAEEEA